MIPKALLAKTKTLNEKEAAGLKATYTRLVSKGYVLKKVKKKLTQDLSDTSNPSVVSTVGLSENETWRKSMPPQKYKTLNENQC